MGNAIVGLGNVGGLLAHAFAHVSYRVYAGVQDFQGTTSIGFSKCCDFWR